MEQRSIEPEVRDSALDTLLRDHPEAIVAALGDDGFRVPLPATVPLAAHRRLPVPEDRATLLDVVAPGDAMTVITTWERALANGMAITTVHLRSAPERALALTFVDARHRHGTWLATITEPEGEASTNDGGTRAGALPPAVRPRTATVHKSAHAIITAIDDRTTRMLGWSPGEMVGARSLEFYHPDDRDRAVANWMEMLSKRESHRVRLRHRCRDGSWLWVEFENVYQGAERMEDVVIVSQMSDISDEMAAHEAVDQREKLFRRLAESLPTGLLQVDRRGRAVYANARLATILGVAADAGVEDCLATVVPDDRPALDAAIAALSAGARDRTLEISIRRPGGGELRQCEVHLIALTGSEGTPGVLACVSDITDSARMREELEVRATYDDLTGCHNRASVLAVLDHALATGEGMLTGVVFIDLDRFKAINDTQGHAAGDEVLVTAARTLRGLSRAGDVVGRIGGDEFLLVCTRLQQPAEAMAIAERVGAALRRRITLPAGAVDLCASVGVACSRGEISSDTLIAHADAAMYASKQQGEGRPVLHDADGGGRQHDHSAA